jgi:hypothetical protein
MSTFQGGFVARGGRILGGIGNAIKGVSEAASDAAFLAHQDVKDENWPTIKPIAVRYARKLAETGDAALDTLINDMNQTSLSDDGRSNLLLALAKTQVLSPVIIRHAAALPVETGKLSYLKAIDRASAIDNVSRQYGVTKEDRLEADRLLTLNAIAHAKAAATAYKKKAIPAKNIAASAGMVTAALIVGGAAITAMLQISSASNAADAQIAEVEAYNKSHPTDLKVIPSKVTKIPGMVASGISLLLAVGTGAYSLYSILSDPATEARDAAQKYMLKAQQTARIAKENFTKEHPSVPLVIKTSAQASRDSEAQRAAYEEELRLAQELSAGSSSSSSSSSPYSAYTSSLGSSASRSGGSGGNSRVSGSKSSMEQSIGRYSRVDPGYFERRRGELYQRKTS